METTTNQSQEKFDHWAIVELMGHVRLAGRVTEEKRFGVEMGRIDIPGDDDKWVTQYFGGGSVYRITPTTEENARQIAKKAPAPIQAWELREANPLPSPVEEGYVDEDYDESDPWEDN